MTKTFLRISLKYLTKVQVTRELNRGKTKRIKDNGELSNEININAGIRQWDSPLNNKRSEEYKQGNRIIKILEYADDIIMAT